MALRTESDLVQALSGTVRLSDLYAAAEAAGLDRRDAGGEVVHGTGDTRCRRRVRNALQAAKRQGRATRVGRSTWVLDDMSPRIGFALLLAGGELGDLELVVEDACELFGSLADDGVAVDAIVTDPPWGLGRRQAGDPLRDGSERLYRRDSRAVIRGYVDVEPDRYRDFTRRWTAAAAELLAGRAGSYLCVVTGPQQAAAVQVSAEDAGLSYVTSLAAKRLFPLYSTRRPAFGHFVVTVLSAGRLDDRRRFFWPAGLEQRARSGRPYPSTWLGEVGRADRTGQLRYDNALPPDLVRRLLSAFTAGPENGGEVGQSLVVDGFVGGGEVAVACARMGRRFVGCDVNHAAVEFSAGRVLDEVCWPEETQVRLFAS